MARNIVPISTGLDFSEQTRLYSFSIVKQQVIQPFRLFELLLLKPTSVDQVFEFSLELDHASHLNVWSLHEFGDCLFERTLCHSGHTGI
jgi:hypothetical protein